LLELFTKANSNGRVKIIYYKDMEKYIEEVCEHCGQSITYLATIDQGTVDILRAISVAIYRKGINVIHPRKEMEVGQTSNHASMVRNGQITSNMTGNLSKARFHGLIASVKGEAGNYCITTKGAQFLRGRIIPRHAIISKARKDVDNIGYYLETTETASIREFTNSADHSYWEVINFDVVAGRIIKGVPIKKVEQETKNLKLC
jgi:hypothetical protein